MPESFLKDILDFLKIAENQTADRLRMTRNLSDILMEDRELLEKLAK
jgi:hypothetical protein